MRGLLQNARISRRFLLVRLCDFQHRKLTEHGEEMPTARGLWPPRSFVEALHLDIFQQSIREEENEATFSKIIRVLSAEQAQLFVWWTR